MNASPNRFGIYRPLSIESESNINSGLLDIREDISFNNKYYRATLLSPSRTDNLSDKTIERLLNSMPSSANDPLELGVSGLRLFTKRNQTILSIRLGNNATFSGEVDSLMRSLPKDRLSRAALPLVYLGNLDNKATVEQLSQTVRNLPQSVMLEQPIYTFYE